MYTTVITNCRLLSPGKDIAHGSLLIEDGFIKEVAEGNVPVPAGAKIIDGEGLTAMPGFIDLHCHGRNGFDFCDGFSGNVQAIGEGKLAEGVTTLLPATLTLSEDVLKDSLSAIAACDQKSTCRIPGVHLEGPFINPECAGAQNTAFVRCPDVAEVARLNKVFPINKISFAIESAGGVQFVSDMLQCGIVPSSTHSSAGYDVFLKAYAAGLRNLSHFCNQMSPLHHRDIGLVGAGLLYKDVFVELICDKLHISPPMIQLVFNTKGADNIMLITDAMRASGMPDGEYSLGGLPVTVADGAARLKDSGALAGSTLQMAEAFKNICEVTGLPQSELIKSTAASAAGAMNWHDRGFLMPGFLADIVLLDKNFKVRKTLVGGEIRFEN